MRKDIEQGRRVKELFSVERLRENWAQHPEELIVIREILCKEPHEISQDDQKRVRSIFRSSNIKFDLDKSVVMMQDHCYLTLAGLAVTMGHVWALPYTLYRYDESIVSQHLPNGAIFTYRLLDQAARLRQWGSAEALLQHQTATPSPDDVQTIPRWQSALALSHAEWADGKALNVASQLPDFVRELITPLLLRGYEATEAIDARPLGRWTALVSNPEDHSRVNLNKSLT